MSTDADALLERVATNATKPASASNDGQSATQHNLRDQLEVVKQLRSADAAALGFGGVLRQQSRSPNALGGNS